MSCTPTYQHSRIEVYSATTPITTQQRWAPVGGWALQYMLQIQQGTKTTHECTIWCQVVVSQVAMKKNEAKSKKSKTRAGQPWSLRTEQWGFPLRQHMSRDLNGWSKSHRLSREKHVPDDGTQSAKALSNKAPGGRPQPDGRKGRRALRGSQGWADVWPCDCVEL